MFLMVSNADVFVRNVTFSLVFITNVEYGAHHKSCEWYFLHLSNPFAFKRKEPLTIVLAIAVYRFSAIYYLPCWPPSPNSDGLWLFIQFESVLQPGSRFSFLGWLYVYHHLKQTEEATVYRDREYLYLRIQWNIVISWDAWIGLFIYLFVYLVLDK